MGTCDPHALWHSARVATPSGWEPRWSNATSSCASAGGARCTGTGHVYVMVTLRGTLVVRVPVNPRRSSAPWAAHSRGCGGRLPADTVAPGVTCRAKQHGLGLGLGVLHASPLAGEVRLQVRLPTSTASHSPQPPASRPGAGERRVRPGGAVRDGDALVTPVILPLPLTVAAAEAHGVGAGPDYDAAAVDAG